MNFSSFQDKLMDFLCDDPNFCVNNGVSQKLGELPDPGKNKRITKQGKLKMLVNALNDIKKSDLTFDDQIDYELCHLQLEQERLDLELEIDGIPQLMRMPRATAHLIDPIFMLFINDPRYPKLRLVNIISRLEKFNEFIISYKRNIKGPVKRWLDMELQTLEGLPSFFDSIKNWAVSVEFKNMDRLNKAITSAKSALFNYEVFLKNEPTSVFIHIGPAQMQEILDSRGIKMSPTELFEMAKSFLDQNLIERKKLQNKLEKKYNLIEGEEIDLVNFLNEKFKVNDEGKNNDDPFGYVLERYEVEREKVLSFIKEKKLFPVMEEQDMHMMQTPTFMIPTIPAGAMMAVMAFRAGIKKSLVYLTLSEELLSEHTELKIPIMMIHEGIPGHHLQFAWSSSHKSNIRKLFSANDYSEGWTTMLEDYMLDAGYSSEISDEIKFVGKRDIARLAARVCIDLYFMSGDKSYLDVGLDIDLTSDDAFVAAGKFLQKITGFVDGRVQGELNWYSQESGYPLSYLTGNKLVWKLKRDFGTKLKEKMTELEIDQLFHKIYLEAGNMPVALLRDLFSEELKNRSVSSTFSQ